MPNAAEPPQPKPADSLRTLGLMAAGVSAGWLLYSRLGIDHNVHLPEALNAERKQFMLPAAGLLSYYVASEAEGHPLVLIHSINAAASTFEMKPLFEAYRPQRPVYALDLPGFGFSDRTERRYSVRLYTDAILKFLEDEVGSPADVVALSLGCEFAARAAHEAPELFRSLALISPSGLNAEEVHVPEQTLYGFFTFPLWSQALFDLIVTRRAIRYFLGKNFAGDPLEAVIEYAFLTAHQPGAKHAPFYFVSGQLFTPDIRTQVYEKLARPTLVIYDSDPNVSFEQLPAVLDRNENWQAAKISPTRGLPHWEKPQETQTALDKFWSANH